MARLAEAPMGEGRDPLTTPGQSQRPAPGASQGVAVRAPAEPRRRHPAHGRSSQLCLCVCGILWFSDRFCLLQAPSLHPARH